jgi:hypothetical protein
MSDNDYLKDLLASQQLEEGCEELQALDAEVANVESIIREAYPASNLTFSNGGSRAKRTMIREDYDLDKVSYFGNEDTAPGEALEDIYDNLASLLEDEPVRNFLIGNGLIEEGEPWPHGDRSHGAKGILEFYAEFLSTTDPMKVAKFLLDLVQGKVRGHWACPCGGGQIIRKCHKAAVDDLRKVPQWVITQSGSLILDLLKQQRPTA